MKVQIQKEEDIAGKWVEKKICYMSDSQIMVPIPTSTSPGRVQQ
jgi:hypothetical protein